MELKYFEYFWLGFEEEYSAYIDAIKAAGYEYEEEFIPEEAAGYYHFCGYNITIPALKGIK